MQSDGSYLVGTLEEIVNGQGQVYCHSAKARGYCESVLKTQQDAILAIFRYMPDNSKQLVEIVRNDDAWQYQRDLDRKQRRIDDLEQEIAELRETV